MRKILLLLILSALFVSCSENKYKKAISDYEQTIGKSKLDLKFKALDIKEIRKITVADSLVLAISTAEERITEAKRNLDAEMERFDRDSILYTRHYGENAHSPLETSRKILKISKDMYKNALDLKQYIEKMYAGRDSSEVLRVIVECRYSIENPIFNDVKTELTNQFVMSPDGKICYGRYEEE